MTVIIGEAPTNTAAPRTPFFMRKIRCPGHYLVPITEDIYLKEPIKSRRYCSDAVELCGQKIKIRKERTVTDAFGNKMIDWRKFYQLRRQGIILHPEISARFAIEQVWDPHSVLCRRCDKRCMRGVGTVNEWAIKRLHG